MAGAGDKYARQALQPGSTGFAGNQAYGRPQQQAEVSALQRHPDALNETARQLLQAGNAAGARDVLQQALAADPSNPQLWLNLAAALRGLNQSDDEMAALERVLGVEPYNVRALLQKASLHEIQGKPRAAAAIYRSALQAIPPRAEPPPSMTPVLRHAAEVVAANERELENFLEDRLKDLRASHADAPLARFDRCMATLLRKRNIFRPKPTFMYFPNLPALEFYERGDFPWLDSLEAATGEIRAELLDVLADGPESLEPYMKLPDGMGLQQWREINNSRRWGVYHLYREGVPITDHLARCPRTVAALAAWPRYDVPRCGPTAMFSILDANTRIPPHTGVSNTRLVVHLPLIVPPGCGFRVGAETREWHPGHAFVFDDTIEHEAWNDSDVPRAVLIVDIWNPYLSDAERDLVRSLTEGVGEYYGTQLYHGA